MAFFKKKKDEVDSDYEKQSEEAKIVSSFTASYRVAYANKAALHSQWDKNFKAYDSSLFKKNLPDYKTQEISNFVFSTVETIKPIMLSGNPKFMVLPNKESDFSKAESVQHALDHEWVRTKMFSLLNTALTTGLIYGTSFIGCFWDGNASNGLGQIKPIVLSPFNIFVDSMATSFEDAQRVFYATYKSVGELMEAYPKRAEELKKEAGSIQDEYLVHGKNVGTGATNQILYIECYSKDYAYDETIEDELDDDGEKTGNKVQIRKRKYPNQRRTVIAGDLLLSDGNSPYEDGKCPITMWKCYDVPGKFWGISEVEMIISPQETICEITNSILESAALTSNPIWVMDKNCGVEKNSISNRKGLVIRKNPGTEVRREQPTALPAYLENIILSMKQDIEQISGVYDVTRGEKPSGVTAAAAIEALNEQAQGRIKLKVQTMEQMLGELGCMNLSRIQQFWVTKRTIRIMGQQYTPNSGIDAQMQQIANPQQGDNPQGINMPDGKTMKFKNLSGDDVDGDFDIFVVAGSTMAVNKTARLQQVIQMAQTTGEDGMPLVDRQTVLENADLPNTQDILQRFEQMKQNKAQQPPPVNPPSVSINYPDLPPEGKVQLAKSIQVEITPEQVIKDEQNKKMADASLQDATHHQDLQKMQMQHEQSMQAQQISHAQDLASQDNQSANQSALQSQSQELESKVGANPNTSSTSTEQNDGGETEQLYTLIQQMVVYMLQNDPNHFAKLAEQIPALGQIVSNMQNNQQ